MLTQRAASPGTHARTDIRTYKGIGVSPGIAIGRAVLIEKREAAAYRVPIREEEVPAEVPDEPGAIELIGGSIEDLRRLLLLDLVITRVLLLRCCGDRTDKGNRRAVRRP